MNNYYITVSTDNEIQLHDNGKEIIELEPLQEAVGGWIEIVHPEGLELICKNELGNPRYIDSLCFVCNEEGLIIGLPWNDIASMLYGGNIAGNILICGTCGEELVGLNKKDAEKVLRFIEDCFYEY